MLEVRAGNATAQSLYRTFEFRTIGVRKGYYSDNREDAILMSLDLDRAVGGGRVSDGGSQTT